MTYQQFLTNLNYQYYIFYEKGLKKQAKNLLALFLNSFDLLDQKIRDDIFFSLCDDLCDDKNKQISLLLERGNGELPYELKTRIRAYLYNECLLNKMPQLRWFYEILHDSSGDASVAIEMLDTAYNHEACDQKTIELMFSRYLSTLAWGSHHFPEGCIIDKAEEDEAISTCLTFLDKHNIPIALKEEFLHFKKLYELFWKYKASNLEDFEEFCKANGLIFTAQKSYYYT